MKPAPMSLNYELLVGAGDTDYFYFDFFKDLSVASRRGLRQGNVLPLQGLRFTSDQTVTVSVSALPFTWVTAEAWEASFRAWMKLNRRALSEDGDSQAAKYLDFKVYFDQIHVAHATTAGVTVPQPLGHAAGTGNASVGYEWDYSRIEIPEDLDLAQAAYPLHMIGDNSFSGIHSLGVIHNYALARSRPQAVDPNVPVGDTGDLGSSYLNLMFDFGGGSLQQVIENVVGENNEPPYPVGMETDPAGNPTEEFYPGGANFLGAAAQHEFARTSIYNIRDPLILANGFLPGALLPLGLMQMTVVNHNETGALSLRVWADMVPGERDGYTTVSMLGMNP